MAEPSTAAHEADVRRRLGDALLRGVSPEERTAALIAVLSAMDLAHKVVDPDGLPRRQVKARAKEIADGDWAAKAVKDAITAAQAAMARPRWSPPRPARRRRQAETVRPANAAIAS